MYCVLFFPFRYCLQLVVQSFVVIIMICAAVVGTMAGIYIFNNDLQIKQSTRPFSSGEWVSE